MTIHQTTITRYLVTVTFLLMLSASVTYSQAFFPIWPEGEMPNTKGLQLEDSIKNQRYYQIGTPGMFAYFPSQEENKGSAVIIVPGGGYHHITYNLSGLQLAKWFNTFGVNAFVLNYRLPLSPDLEQREIGPLQDAQRAMRYVRSKAKEWHIGPEKIGIMGISAGGHLASTLGTHEKDVSKIGDSLDGFSYDPNFMILVSPVISMGPLTHEGSKKYLLGEAPSDELIQQYSNETRVHKGTPPTFLAHAFNDQAVDPRNSLHFYEALIENEVSAALHIFPKGGHEIALRNNPGSTNLWTGLCEAWMEELGLLTKE